MKSNTRKHIFLVDDDPKIRQVIAGTAEQIGATVSCFNTAADCLRRLGTQQCDLLITNIGMSNMDGLQLLREVKSIAPWLPVLVISGYGDIPAAVSAVKAGATDCVERPLERESFLQKLKTLLQENVCADFHAGKPLTDSEMKVLRLVVDGKSSKEIAYVLHRSVRTVEVHRSHIMRKLAAGNLVDLVRRAATMGMVELPARGKLPADPISAVHPT